MKKTLITGMVLCWVGLAVAAPRPNIVLIMVDDMGWSDIGCYGSEIQTPNLDSLATNGIRFRQFYNTAKCNTTRASLLTGVYQHQVGYASGYKSPMRNCVTLGEVLRPTGYHTYASGKHHSTDNLYGRGFDHYYGLFEGACNHFNPGLQRPGEPPPGNKSGNNNDFWADDALVFSTADPSYQYYFPSNFYTTDFFTAKAKEYLDEWHQQDSGHPFFLYLAYTAPHDPLMAWPEDIAKYQGVYDVGYETIRSNRYQKMLDMGLIDAAHYPLSPPAVSGVSLAWDTLSADEKADQSRRKQVYAAMIDRLDQKIGEIISQLKAMGVYDDTLIMFLSDNGADASSPSGGDPLAEIGGVARYAAQGKRWAHVSNTPFIYFKTDSEEGGIHTPMIAHWPNGIVNPGRISNKPGHLVDFMATILELSGADYPREFNNQAVVPLQGESFTDVLYDEPIGPRPPLFFEWASGRALRDGDYKLVSNDNGSSWRLYNMAVDATELNDLSGSQAALKSQMITKFNNWLNSVDPNKVPYAVKDFYTGVHASNALIDVLANDVDPDGNGTINASTLIISQQPRFGTASISNNQVLYTPSPTAVVAADQFCYQVQDNQGQWSNEGLVTVDFTTGAISGTTNATIFTQEAEDAPVVTAQILNTRPTASGGEFVNFNTGTNEVIEWRFNVAAPTNCSLFFGYALLSGVRPLQLSVNGVILTTNLQFTSTGSWDVWSENVVTNIALLGGTNTVKLEDLGNDGPNMDYLRVEAIGNASTPPLTDTDSDGMTDFFEVQFGALNKNNPADANLDMDGDGISNREEYDARTDLNNPNSKPGISMTSENSREMRVNWSAFPEQMYQVSFRTNLAVPWSSTNSVAPVSTNGKAWFTRSHNSGFVKVSKE